MCVHSFCVFAVLSVGSVLVTGSSPVKGVLPIVYSITKLKRLPGPN
jgi:hypothetical protein